MVFTLRRCAFHRSNLHADIPRSGDFKNDLAERPGRLFAFVFALRLHRNCRCLSLDLLEAQARDVAEEQAPRVIIEQNSDSNGCITAKPEVIPKMAEISAFFLPSEHCSESGFHAVGKAGEATRCESS